MQPLRVGDVLRCHRVRAQRWQGLLQLIGHPEKGTAFVVFSPVIDLLTGNFILNPNPPEAEPDGVEETKGDELPSTLEAEFNRCFKLPVPCAWPLARPLEEGRWSNLIVIVRVDAGCSGQ